VEIVMGKRFVSRVSPSIHCLCASLSVVCFQSKRRQFWTHVVLLPAFGLGFDEKETTEAHGGWNLLPQQ
jgi:hypothetical protein